MSTIVEPTSALRPIQAFDDNLRPARLMLNVYRLLDCGDEILTAGEFVERLRDLVRASGAEELMVVQNEIFLGLVREKSGLPRSELRRATLTHLLRLAIVASCTALETYLPALLKLRLPDLIRLKGRDFLPPDETVRDYCKDLLFNVDEVLRLVADPEAAIYISNKLVGLSGFKYLSGSKGIHVVGALLGLDKPWDSIATHLARDRRELVKAVDETARRRNDIVHRADRAQTAPDGEQQTLTPAQTKQGVETIGVVCLALDELVEARLKDLKSLAEAS
jgi:hypothetical protein